MIRKRDQSKMWLEVFSGNPILSIMVITLVINFKPRLCVLDHQNLDFDSPSYHIQPHLTKYI